MPSAELTQLSISLAKSWPTKIIDISKKNFEENKTDCKKFVQAVAVDLGVFLPDLDATSTVEYLLTSAEWNHHNSHYKAIEQAKMGMFVVAGATKKSLDDTHGHVSVVVGTIPEKIGYPNVYSGSLSYAPGRVQDKSIRWTFPTTFVEDAKVHYFAKWPTAL